ncbi:esterase-like activity of phytase family protein [Calothrix sp. PCC 6303]|uniref:esterase-like activity of phytase family protein n=1 Tax=Calothrix sp. PCC 6303 TaxID=1170562 RepID=UPI0002A035F6|nr:esterase-like activity of phytase family protein [Calothrix sp. PCC 6303]AFZ02267.1 hypothetical protein Cal6303_3328 [Calothrix sp. PCC 6303]
MQLIKKNNIWKKIIYFCLPIILIGLFFANFTSPSVEIVGADFIGEAVLKTGTLFQNTQVGGLSGITYDASNQVYYAISDDRGDKAPARFYTLKIDLSKGKLQQGGVVPVGVTLLLDAQGKNFASTTTDTEGIALTQKGDIYVSSEGDVGKSINPFIKEFTLASGKEVKTLPVPEKFLPTSSKRGIRNNLGFESLTVTPDHQFLYTATENALVQDGSEAKPNTSSPCRILQYNLATNQAEKEFLYPTEAAPATIKIINKYANGLPDLVALDNQGNLLSLERAFTGFGFSVKLFKVSLEGATDIRNIDSLLATDIANIQPVRKQLLLDLGKENVLLDNIEGLTLGSQLADGQPSLILISDNNFNKLQRTQILALRLKTESSSPILRFFRQLVPNSNK